jgi:hypothetical protein
MANIEIERRPRSSNLPWLLALVVLAAIIAYFVMNQTGGVHP